MARKKHDLKALENVRVVLIESKYSGNIGLTARVMKNLGFADLRLVRPRAELNKEAYARAAHGTEVIDCSKIHADLPDAVSDCGIVIGTSRRYCESRKNIIGLEQMTGLLRPALPANKVALVFGSEDAGISDRDAKHCHWVVRIDTGAEYDTMNVSHAAAIVLWEVNRISREPAKAAPALAESSDMEAMYRHMREVFTEIDFVEPGDPRRMMLNFRTIFNRAMLSPREVNIVRGVLRKVSWRIKTARKMGRQGISGKENLDE
jgi:TrmH family RNA methyltransferase